MAEQKTTETIALRTDQYEREHGKSPSGKAYWRFKLCTDRATEKDHFFNSRANAAYEKALREAFDLAVRRRASCIVVLP